MKVIKGLFAAFFVFCLCSCFTSFFEVTEESIDGESYERPHTTRVQFDNTGDANVHKVSVFTTRERDRWSDAPIDTINAGSISISHGIEPHSQFVFYYTYFLKIGDREVPYIPLDRYGRGESVFSIRRDQTTTVTIRSLRDSIMESAPADINEPLVTGIYFTIQNNSPSSVQFVVNESALFDLERERFINPFSNTMFEYSEGISLLNLNNTGIRSTQTAIVTPLNTIGIIFQQGYFYSLVFDGSSIIVADSDPLNWINTAN